MHTKAQSNVTEKSTFINIMFCYMKNHNPYLSNTCCYSHYHSQYIL